VYSVRYNRYIASMFIYYIDSIMYCLWYWYYFIWWFV